MADFFSNHPWVFAFDRSGSAEQAVDFADFYFTIFLPEYGGTWAAGALDEAWALYLTGEVW